jgi:hypothetical protein
MLQIKIKLKNFRRQNLIVSVFSSVTAKGTQTSCIATLSKYFKVVCESNFFWVNVAILIEINMFGQYVWLHLVNFVDTLKYFPSLGHLVKVR